jgi:hypothetical protein
MATIPNLTGSATLVMTIGSTALSCLAANTGCATSCGDKDIDVETHKLSGKVAQLITLPTCPAIVDSDVLSLNVPEFEQTSSERFDEAAESISPALRKNSDVRHFSCGLLRARQVAILPPRRR